MMILILNVIFIYINGAIHLPEGCTEINEAHEL